MSLFAEFHWMKRRLDALGLELRSPERLPSHERAVVDKGGCVLVTGTPEEIIAWLRAEAVEVSA